jgi:predicted outer membrane repeat protein
MFAGIQGSFGAAMMISRSCVIFTGHNILSNNSASYGGSLYMFESVVTLRGINTFKNNTSEYPKADIFDSQCLEDDGNGRSLGFGGVIYSNFSILNINSEYSVFANNLAHESGGAIHAEYGKITIKGSVIFMENAVYEGEGGAMFLVLVTLIVNGNISFINNEAHSGGALSVIALQAKFLTIYYIDEERIANEKTIISDATKFCRNVAMNGETDTANTEAKNVSVLDSYNGNFNESGKGVAMFHGNIAFLEGGGVKCTGDSDMIIFDVSVRFENNTAMYGGGMYLGENSKLTLSPSIHNDVSFVLNHAKSVGGALYVDDSRCSTRPRVCFLSVYGDNYYNVTKLSLLFLNNSAGFKGSTLYGGQLNRCRLRFIADIGMDECGNRSCLRIHIRWISNI